LYGSYSALDRDINYLMHWRPKGSKNGYHDPSKRQYPPEFYVNGANTIGFDPAVYEKSKLYRKLKDKQDDLKKGSKEAKYLSADMARNAKKFNEESKEYTSLKDKEDNGNSFKKFFFPEYKKESKARSEEYQRKKEQSDINYKKSASASKKYWLTSKWLGAASSLMNIPIGAVKLAIRTKDFITNNKLSKAIRNTKIAKSVEKMANKFNDFINDLFKHNKSTVVSKNNKKKETLNDKTSKSLNDKTSKSFNPNLKDLPGPAFEAYDSNKKKIS